MLNFLRLLFTYSLLILIPLISPLYAENLENKISEEELANSLPIPIFKPWITDEANLFSSNELYNLNEKIDAIKQKTGAQLAILTLSTINQNQLNRYADEVFYQWFLNRKNDENALLIVVTKEGEYAIKISDKISKLRNDQYSNQLFEHELSYNNDWLNRLLEHEINYYFPQQKFAQAFDTALTNYSLTLNGKDVQLIDYHANPRHFITQKNVDLLLLGYLIIFILVGYALFLAIILTIFKTIPFVRKEKIQYDDLMGISIAHWGILFIPCLIFFTDFDLMQGIVIYTFLFGFIAAVTNAIYKTVCVLIYKFGFPEQYNKKMTEQKRTANGGGSFYSAYLHYGSRDDRK